MENQSQETDARILLRYISTCADSRNPAPPMLVLRVALDMVDKFRTNPDTDKTAWDYIKEANATIQQTTKLDYYRMSPGYQVATAMYVILKSEGLKTMQEEALANDLLQVLIDRSHKNYYFKQEEAEQVIQEMIRFKQTAPPTINPLELFAEIGRGKNLAQVDWGVAFNEVVKYQHLFGKTFPYYLLLHTFLHVIPYPTWRVDVLGYLQNMAEKKLDEREAKIFVEEARYLIHIYMRMNGLFCNPIPKIWKDQPDMDELTVFIKDVQPEELVCIAQSIYDSREIVGQRIGMVQHILRLEKYSGRLLTTNSYDFCKCLYMAHGYRMLMMSGKEDFRELPTIDNLDCEFRNACFDIYIHLRAEQILQEQKHNNRRLYPPKIEDCYAQLADELAAQYQEMGQVIAANTPNFMARESLLLAMQFLAQYAKDKQIEKAHEAHISEQISQQVASSRSVIIQTPQVKIEKNFGQINSIENSDVNLNK